MRERARIVVRYAKHSPADRGRDRPTTRSPRTPASLLDDAFVDQPAVDGELAFLVAHERARHHRAEDLINAGLLDRIEFEARGMGIHAICLRVRRCVDETLRLFVPAGTFFSAGSPSVQNMVTTEDMIVPLVDDGWAEIHLPGACANRERKAPGSGDRYTILRSSGAVGMADLIAVLQGSAASYPVRQAAVWIVTDDATYADLGLARQQPMVETRGAADARLIGEDEAAAAIQACALAGIDVSKRAIWTSIATILDGLRDPAMKRWLRRYAARRS